MRKRLGHHATCGLAIQGDLLKRAPYWAQPLASAQTDSTASSSWGQPPPARSPAPWGDAGQPAGSSNDSPFNSDTDADAESDDGTGEIARPADMPHGGTEQEQAQYLFLDYQLAKKRWGRL